MWPVSVCSAGVCVVDICMPVSTVRVCVCAACMSNAGN